MNKHWSNLIVLLAMLVSAFTPASAQASFTPLSDPGVRVLAAPQAAGLLKANAAVALAHYGSFSLWQLPTGIAAPEGAIVVDPTIYLREIQIDTNEAEPVKIPLALQSTEGIQEGFWMVQFAGPIQDVWLDDLKAQGLEIVTYIPENAYIVWGMTPGKVF